MICATAFYPAAGEARFDARYYLDSHIPLVKRLLTPYGLVRLEVDEGVSGAAQGFPPNYLYIARMYFESAEGFQAAFQAVGAELLNDVPNYTDIPVELQVSKTLSF